MSYSFVGFSKNSANANTISRSVTAGNCAIIVSRTSSGGGTPTLTGVVDNLGNALTQAVASYQNSLGEWISAYYAPAAPSGVTGYTATYNGGTPGTCLLAAIEYSGIGTSSPLITSKVNTQSAPGVGADAITTGTIAITVSGVPAAAVIGIVTNSGDSDTANGTNFTSRYGTGTDNDWFIEDRRITSTATLAVTATAATHGGTGQYTSMLLALAEPASGSTGTLAATESGSDTCAATGGVGNNGVRLTLRDTDTGALAASLTGLIVSVRSTSNGGTVLAGSTSESTDGSGILEFPSASIGNLGDYVYVTVDKSDHSVVATYRVQVIDLNA